MNRAYRNVPFAPSRSYLIKQGDGTIYTAEVYGKTRRQEFGGNNQIVRHDGSTGIATAQYSGLTRTGSTIESTYPNGESTHYEKIGTRWRVAYNTGEALTASACRCQLSGYPLPPGRMMFDMIVQFGDATDNWTLTTDDVSPALFWQLKPTVGQPVWALTVDTDAADSSKLDIAFSRRQYVSTGSVVRAGTASGLERHTPINVVVDGLFTFDSTGWIECRVNNRVIYSAENITTLQPDTSTYYQMIWGLYLFNDLVPASAPTRVTWWDRNRVIVPRASERTIRLVGA